MFTDLLSGATSGIGAETARVLAKHGARLILPARSLKTAEEAKARIVSECPESEIIIMPLDLSSFNSVRNFVAHFHSLRLPLHLLMYYLLATTTYCITLHANFYYFYFILNFNLIFTYSQIIRNNAGKFAHEHAISEDGVEMTFATNYLGKYLTYD